MRLLSIARTHSPHKTDLGNEAPVSRTLSALEGVCVCVSVCVSVRVRACVCVWVGGWGGSDGRKGGTWLLAEGGCQPEPV